jgi:hypothetical protein
MTASSVLARASESELVRYAMMVPAVVAVMLSADYVLSGDLAHDLAALGAIPTFFGSRFNQTPWGLGSAGVQGFVRYAVLSAAVVAAAVGIAPRRGGRTLIPCLSGIAILWAALGVLLGWALMPGVAACVGGGTIALLTRIGGRVRPEERWRTCEREGWSASRVAFVVFFVLMTAPIALLVILSYGGLLLVRLGVDARWINAHSPTLCQCLWPVVTVGCAVAAIRISRLPFPSRLAACGRLAVCLCLVLATGLAPLDQISYRLRGPVNDVRRFVRVLTGSL